MVSSANMDDAAIARAMEWASRLDRYDDTSTHVATLRKESNVVEQAAGSTEEMPMALCARLVASIARRPDDASTILATCGLDAPTFRPILRKHLERIRTDVKQGGSALQRAFDQVYVATLEEERGAIQVMEYVKLVKAARLGNVEETLREMELPVEAWIRIERVWLVRLVRDPALAEKVRRSLSD